MHPILIALAIGITAGTIDVLPMLAKKISKYACASAFLHWVVLGLIIPFVDWDVAVWVKGFLIGLLSAIPVVVIVSEKDKKPTLTILLFSAFLGIGVAIAGKVFIG